MIIAKRKEFQKLKRQIEENQKNIEEIQKDIKQITDYLFKPAVEKESKDKWYQLPNFPDYEITLKGNVRNIQSKEPIPIEIIYANKKAVTKYVNLNGTNQTIKSLLDSIKNNSENKQSKESKEWYTIPGFSNYEINPNGKIRNKNNSKEILPNEGKRNEEYIFLEDSNGKQQKVNLAKVIAKEFIPNPNHYRYVKHVDGNISNNCISNLKWVDYNFNTPKKIISIDLKNNEQEYSSINNAAKQIQQELIQKNIEPMVVSSYHRHIKEVLNEDKLFAGRYWRTIDE